MALKVPFYITSGLPFGKEITVTLPSTRTWWLTASEFEVLAQIREGEDFRSPLLLDLSQFVTHSFSSAHTVFIELKMSGADTRKLIQTGYYGFVMSDIYTDDERAIPILSGTAYRDGVVPEDRMPV